MSLRSFSLALLLAALSSCGPQPGQFGSACTADKDCKTGKCVTSLPDGYCSSDCTGGKCADGAACAPVGGANICLQTCSLDFDCRTGYVCEELGADKICRPKCSADADCGAGLICGVADGHCAIKPGTEAAKVGAACGLNAACKTSRCEGQFPQGYCTLICNMAGEGAKNQACPADSTCARVGEATGMCLANCKANGDCRGGYYCDLSTGAVGVCRAKCRTSDDCGVGYTCETAKGTCLEGAAPPRKIGAGCKIDGDCDQDYCLDEPNQQFPGGTCSDDCTAAGFTCADGNVCIKTTSTSICLQKCGSNFDCRSPYFCQKVANSAAAVCIPRCSENKNMCDAVTEECDTPSGACVKKGTAGQITIQTIDASPATLTIAAAQDNANATGEISFAVPADAASFTMVASAPFGGDVNLFKLTSPSGKELFNYSRMSTSVVRTFQSDSALAVLFPNSPRLAVETGTYKASFIVFNTKGGTSKVNVVLKKSPTASVSRGTMDLNLWFVGVPPLDASSAKTDAQFQSMLTSFKNFYAQTGITLGTVSYFDVDASTASRLSIIESTQGPTSELRELFRYSSHAPAGNGAMNYFFIKEIREDSAGAGYITIGMSGGIPGVPVVQGTPTSGVAVAVLDIQKSPEKVAKLMAHEGGHWLGLFHDTESNGKYFDQLPDTPECPASNDANGNSLMDASECGGGKGAENVMFWLLSDNRLFTNNQSFVVLHNPAIK